MASGTTTNYFLSYPLSTDLVNVAGDIEELADDLDTFLTSPTFINNINIAGGVINTSSPSATIFPVNATSISIGNIATNINFGSNSGSTTINNASTVFEGIVEVRGNTIQTNQTTFNLLNSVATTINLGASATTINVGASDGQVNIRGNLNIAENKVYEINDIPVISSSALGSGIISSSLEELGTVTTGIWDATTIAVSKGGTGLTSYAVGDIIYASAPTTLNKIAGVETGNALISGGVDTAPFYGKIGLTTHISGILGPENGGTGIDNSGKTITLGGNLETTGSYNLNLILSDNTSASMPVSGSVAVLSNKISDFASSTSTELRSKISGTTGTNNLVFSSSPTLSGTPLAPTASVDTNTTQIATTEFVLAQASGSNPLALGSVSQGTSTRYARQDHVHPTTGLGLTSETLAQFASTTSLQLAGIISDETGSGSLVFGTSPTLTTPIVSGNLRISGAAPTIASASAISPTTEILFISGTAAIRTINSPFGVGNGGRITIIPTGAFTTNTLGNIALATTAVVNRTLIMTYDPITQKWYPSY